METWLFEGFPDFRLQTTIKSPRNRPCSFQAVWPAGAGQWKHRRFTSLCDPMTQRPPPALKWLRAHSRLRMVRPQVSPSTNRRSSQLPKEIKTYQAESSTICDFSPHKLKANRLSTMSFRPKKLLHPGAQNASALQPIFGDFRSLSGLDGKASQGSGQLHPSHLIKLRRMFTEDSSKSNWLIILAAQAPGIQHPDAPYSCLRVQHLVHLGV